MGQRVQSDQIVLDPQKRGINNANRQEYEPLMTLIDDKIKRPAHVQLASVSGTDAIIQIFASPIQKLYGNADQSVSGYNHEMIASVAGNFRSYPESFLNVDDGSVSGDIDLGTVPSTTDGYWRWLLITAKSNEDKYALTFGEEVSGIPDFGVSMPALPSKQSETAVVRLHNSGGGQWNYLRPSPSDIFCVAKGGGGGSADDTGLGGGDLADLLYNARLEDKLNESPSADLPVDISTGKTDSSLYNLINEYYRINYDATVSVSGNGNQIVLTGGAPAFTVKQGDVIVVGDEVVAVSGIGSVNSDGGLSDPMTMESAYTTNPTGVSGVGYCISQAVHTVDLNAFTYGGELVSAGSQFTDDIYEALVSAEDSETQDDIVPDWGSVARIAFSISADGTNWSDKSARTQYISDTTVSVAVPVASNKLYARFFANKTSGSGYVNLLGYKVFWHKDEGELDGENYFTAFARIDTSDYVNCSHSVVSSKSQFTFTDAYPVGLNPGDPSGSALEIYVDGKLVPRYIDGTLVDTSGAYFKEIDAYTIEMDTDYSSAGVDFQFKVPRLVIDTNTQNTTRLTTLENVVYNIPNNYIINSDMQVSQRGSYSATSVTSGLIYVDRWVVQFSGVTATLTHSSSSQPSALSGSKSIRLNATSSASGVLAFTQKIEDYAKFIGKYITFSVWMKTTCPGYIYIQTNAGFIGNSNAHTGSGNWELLQGSCLIPSGTTYVNFYPRVDDASMTAADYMEITGAQLTLGTTYVPFSPKTLAEEWRDCLRHCFVLKSSNFIVAPCIYNDGNNLDWIYTLPVPMRVAPTSFTFVGTANTDYYVVNYSGGAAQVGFTFSHVGSTPISSRFRAGKTSHGLTSNPYINFTTSGALIISADLV